MTYVEFLSFLIEDGIEAARLDYLDHPYKQEGAIDGFNECRALQPHALTNLLQDAQQTARVKWLVQAGDYWYWRLREAEIEWVCDVVSAVLYWHGHPVIIVPTTRGILRAIDILVPLQQIKLLR